MKQHRHASAQIPVLTSVLAAGTIMAAVTLILTGNVLSPKTVIPSVYTQSPGQDSQLSGNTTDCALLSQSLEPKFMLDKDSVKKRQKINKGDLFVVSLEENQTTGYQWNFIYGEADFRLVCRSHQPVEQGTLGAGGQADYYFEALSTISDNAVIIADYRRVFEDNPPIETVVMEFSVQ